MIGLSVKRMAGGLAVMYTALALGANPVLAAGDLEALRVGDLRKLVIHSQPLATTEAPFFTPEGAAQSLADYHGKWVVLNFWATWCAPCRAEMPALDALQAERGGEGFAVVPVATGPNRLPAIETFFEKTGVTRLPILLDPKKALAAPMGVVGLPVTVILNPQGQEVARMTGEADWNSPEAKAMLDALAAR